MVALRPPATAPVSDEAPVSLLSSKAFCLGLLFASLTNTKKIFALLPRRSRDPDPEWYAVEHDLKPLPPGWVRDEYSKQIRRPKRDPLPAAGGRGVSDSPAAAAATGDLAAAERSVSVPQVGTEHMAPEGAGRASAELSAAGAAAAAEAPAGDVETGQGVAAEAVSEAAPGAEPLAAAPRDAPGATASDARATGLEDSAAVAPEAAPVGGVTWSGYGEIALPANWGAMERYCKTCNVWRPPRTSHCPTCGCDSSLQIAREACDNRSRSLLDTRVVILSSLTHHLIVLWWSCQRPVFS